MTTWVLLRGLTREARHWGDFPRRLAAVPGCDDVVCIDLPGNGALHARRSPLDVAAMADHCHLELAARGVARPCAVLAMSLGAMVAIAWAARHAGDIEAAVLVNTSVRPWCRFHQRLRARNYPRMVRLLLGRPPAQTIEGAILELTSGRVWTPAARDALLDAWCRYREERPVSPANAVRQLIAAARYRAPARPPPIPMLLLASAGDGLVDSECSRRLAHAWRLPLALHPSAGHDLPLDDPSWVIDQVMAWSSAPSRRA